jgi:hypothetical protein
MYASIQRYHRTATPGSDSSDIGWRLGTILARSHGFIAAVVVEGIGGALSTIKLFDDQASLNAATPASERWMLEQGGISELGATEVASGEVVAQKGL